ncbi:tyrosine protein phosphatase [Starmerella bacillaris]|uniref:protein-tyrosine-phosphatase n=1 Tax=Starmerella bacillaris TaxID=1247836 RepID=A0AAV5RLS9_STABA|nr:tyrosine protein phosphatase [Starmerella bacillaris]
MCGKINSPTSQQVPTKTSTGFPHIYDSYTLVEPVMIQNCHTEPVSSLQNMKTNDRPESVAPIRSSSDSALSPLANSRRFRSPKRDLDHNIQPLKPRDLSRYIDDKHTLIVDVRPFSLFRYAKLRNATSICVPSTLLRRQTFGMDRVLDFVPVCDIDKVQNLSSLTMLIFYDQNSRECLLDGSISRTAAKFLTADANLRTKAYWIVGGMDSVHAEAEEVVDYSEESESEDNTGSRGNNGTLEPLKESNSGDAAQSSCSPSPIGASKSKIKSNSSSPTLTSLGAKFHPKLVLSNIKPPVPVLNMWNSASHKTRSQLDESTKLTVSEDVRKLIDEQKFPKWIAYAVVETETGHNVLAESFRTLELDEYRRKNPQTTPLIPFKSHSSYSSNQSYEFQMPRLTPTSLKDSPTTPGDVFLNSPSPTLKDFHMAELYREKEKKPYKYTLFHGNPRKNRYTNIAPYQYNRVIVGESTYINASFISSKLTPLRYIATQAPIPASFGDFWWCIWEQKVPIIVMLTSLVTISGQVKSHVYWDTADYNGLSVHVVSEHDEPLNGEVGTLKLRRIGLKYQSEYREITQIHYEGWPDLGCPAHPDVVVELVRLKKQILANDPFSDESSHVVVHCSAGCGRTGTFCTVDTVIHSLDQLPWNDVLNEKKDKVFEVASEFRDQRVSMVQTQAQLLLCYKCIILYCMHRIENKIIA